VGKDPGLLLLCFLQSRRNADFLTPELCYVYHAIGWGGEGAGTPQGKQRPKGGTSWLILRPHPTGLLAAHGGGAVSQAENRQPETAANLAALEIVRTSLQEALGHAQRAYPPRGARRIELLIHAALRETDVQIDNLKAQH
jgi:hypothetical protein